MILTSPECGMQVRQKMVGKSEPSYSQYTCYTGIADFTPPDIDTVGYRVFLGNGRYFVSSDVGGGKMQWYGFHKEPQGESATHIHLICRFECRTLYMLGCSQYKHDAILAASLRPHGQTLQPLQTWPSLPLLSS